MGFLDVAILRTIDGPELTLPGDAALEFFLRLVPEWFFDRIGAPAEKNDGSDAESDRVGLQARTILKEVISDK
jgi:hypothetical protein